MVARIDTELKRILTSEGRTQSWLARTVGVDRTLINRYVHGIHRPDLPTRQAIADALGRQEPDVFPIDPEEIAA